MKSKQLKTNEPLIVGIDIHPGCLAAVAALDQPGSEPLVVWQHSRINFSDWENWIKGNLRPCDTVVLEAGCNSFAFLELAAKCGIEGVVLDSRKVGQISKAYFKNDAYDALKIVRVYLSGLSDRIWVPDEKTRHRREILSRYLAAVRDCTRARNSLKSMLTAHLLRLPKGYNTGIKNERAFAWILKAQEWSASEKEMLEIMFEDIRFSLQQRDRLKKIIAREVLKDRQMLALMRLCGIRIIATYALMAYIGNVRRFKEPKKLAAYVGLVPRIHASGNHKYSGGVGTSGNRVLRAILTQSAQSILRSTAEGGGKLRRWGLAIAARKRNRNIAVSAVARKLIVAVWYLLNGHVVGATEETQAIRWKVNAIIRELGVNTIEGLGFCQTKDLREYLVKKLLAIG